MCVRVRARACVCVLQIEQVSQLAALVQAQLEYHRRSAEILQQLSSKMEDRYGSAPLSCGRGGGVTPAVCSCLQDKGGVLQTSEGVCSQTPDDAGAAAPQREPQRRDPQRQISREIPR